MTYRPSRLTKAIIPRRTVIFGDSLTDVCGGTQLDGSIESYFANGYFSWANTFLKQKLDLIVNAGVSGNNTTQMLARISADVIAYTPDIVIVFGGVNDITGVSDSSTRIAAIATVKANLGEIYDRLNAAGVLVVAVPIWPIDATDLTNSHGRQALSEINWWIRKQGYERRVVVADMGLGFGDRSTAAEILYEAGGHPAYTTDGIHPTATGACVAGRILADCLSPLLGHVDPIEPYNDYTNLLKNPALLGATGATEPTDWDSTMLAGSVSHSYTARTDGLSEDWLTLALSSSAQLAFQQTVDTMTIATGDQFQACIEYEFSSPAGTIDRCCALELDIRSAGAASQFKRYCCGDVNMQSGGSTKILDADVPPRSGILKTPICTAPAGAAGGFIQLVFWVFGDGTLNIGRVSLVKVN